MFKPVPIIVSIAICGLLASLSSAEIDLTKFDAHVFREHDLFEIVHELAVQFPAEVSEMFMQVADVAYNDRSLGKEMFEQFIGVDELRNATRRCQICTVLFTAFGTVGQNASDKILSTIISGCKALIGAINNFLNRLPITRVDIKADPLCSGTVMLQGPQIRDVLQQGGINKFKTAGELCENLNMCFAPSTASNPGTRFISPSPQVATATEYVADERTAEIINKRQSRIVNKDDYITVAQLTDIHLEPDYAIGSPKDCGLPVCCIEKWNGDGQGQARAFGEYTCNTPQRTVEQFLAKVGKMNPDIVLFSGDIPPHTIWEETEQSQYNCTLLLTESIRKMMPGRVVYPCIGNHETYPTNMFSVENLKYTPSFLSTFGSSWKDIANFTQQQLLTISTGGYYSMQIRDGLRLIAFNSDYMYSMNWYNALNARSTRLKASELSRTQTFLKNQLQQAKNNNEKVILLSHHPIGGADSIIRLSRWYQSLVVNYSDVIVLQPTGHTHIDELRMIYNSSGNPVSVMLVSPSVTSYDTRNPSMRLFYLNKTDFSLVDYEQYFYSLGNSLYSAQETNEQAADNIDITESITLLYSAKTAYGMPDLSPQSWDDLTERFATDRSLLLRSLSYSDAAAKPQYICRSRCQHKYICRQRNADYDLYRECEDSYDDGRDSTTATSDPDTMEPVTDIPPEPDTRPVETTEDTTTQTVSSTDVGTGGSISLSCCRKLSVLFVIALNAVFLI